MDLPGQKVAGATQTIGPGATQVTIQSVDPQGMAMVQDRLGKIYPLISVRSMMGSGTYPQPGEDWTIQRMNGSYTFMTRVIAKPTVITGSRSADLQSVLGQVLTALSKAGIVDDRTTP